MSDYFMQMMFCCIPKVSLKLQTFHLFSPISQTHWRSGQHVFGCKYSDLNLNKNNLIDIILMCKQHVNWAIYLCDLVYCKCRPTKKINKK